MNCQHITSNPAYYDNRVRIINVEQPLDNPAYDNEPLTETCDVCHGSGAIYYVGEDEVSKAEYDALCSTEIGRKCMGRISMSEKCEVCSGEGKILIDQYDSVMGN